MIIIISFTFLHSGISFLRPNTTKCDKWSISLMFLLFFCGFFSLYIQIIILFLSKNTFFELARERTLNKSFYTCWISPPMAFFFFFIAFFTLPHTQQLFSLQFSLFLLLFSFSFLFQHFSFFFSFKSICLWNIIKRRIADNLTIYKWFKKKFFFLFIFFISR